MRYEAVVHAAAMMFKSDFMLIEPIASCHEKSLRYDLPGGYKFWQKRDRKYISLTSGIIVLTLPGWKESEGVTDEIAYAKTLGMPVYYLNPKLFFNTADFNIKFNFPARS